MTAGKLANDAVTAASLADGIPSDLRYVTNFPAGDSLDKTVQANCPAGWLARAVEVNGGTAEAWRLLVTVACAKF